VRLPPGLILTMRGTLLGVAVIAALVFLYVLVMADWD
jgi:hypothetical protein